MKFFPLPAVCRYTSLCTMYINSNHKQKNEKLFPTNYSKLFIINSELFTDYLLFQRRISDCRWKLLKFGFQAWYMFSNGSIRHSVSTY